MSDLKQKIIEQTDEIEEKLIAWRRAIHQHPELGNHEFKTAEMVAEHLRAIGVEEVYEHLAGATGVMGIIHGAKPGPIVGIRCDMDCLPVKEETGLPFASCDTGTWGDQGTVPVMHACGHDAHVAMLMAVGEVVNSLKSELAGKVMLIFQPAEEGCASDWVGLSGARRYMQEELYQTNRPDVIFGTHVNPYNPAGTAGTMFCCPGPLGYNMDIIKITLHGESCHGARPWEGKDTIIAAAQIINAVQTIASRDTNANDNSVSVVIGAIKGGSKFNVLAETTVLDGALRFTLGAERQLIERRFREIVEGCAKMNGCTAEIQWTWYPALVNDPKLCAHMADKLTDIMGDKFSQEFEGSFHLLDDFSWFTDGDGKGAIPGMFFGLSCTNDEEGHQPKCHDADFAPNERALKYGVRAMAAAALTYAE